MEIRISTEKDFVEIMQIYEYARKFMIENGNPNQWAASKFPPENLIKSDIENKKSYVCIDDKKIVGTFFFMILAKILSRLTKTFFKTNGKIFLLTE